MKPELHEHVFSYALQIFLWYNALAQKQKDAGLNIEKCSGEEKF